MRRRLALVSLLGVVAAGCAGDASEVPFLPEGRAIGSSHSLTPATHFFGDIVIARVEVRVDRRQLDPARLRVATEFKPYELVGKVKLDRRDLGRYSRLRYEYSLRCFTLACIPERVQIEAGSPDTAPGERRTFRFPPAQIRYDDPSGQFPGLLRSVSWPPVTSVSRLNETEFQSDFPFRATPEALPPPSYSAAPPLVAGGLLLAGLALLAWPASLGLRAWRRRRPPVVEEAAPSLTPLERALLLVEWARERPDRDDRRRSLEVLADELERIGAAAPSEQARRLAWSRDAPSPEALSALLEHVREDDRVPRA
jgi:hypothetical protein